MPRITNNWSVNDNVTASTLNDINQDLDELYTFGSDRAKIIPAQSLLPLAVDIPQFTYRIGTVTGQSVGITDLLVTDNATNYIEISAGGIISSNTIAFDNNKARIGTVTTSGGIITVIQTERFDVIGGDLFGSGLGFQEITSITYDSDDKITQIVADLNTYDITYDQFNEINTIVKNATLTFTVIRDQFGKLQSTTVI
jgi:hypothetical protein